MIFFGGLALILIMLIWFVMTCRNNNARMKEEREKYEEANQEEDNLEMSNQYRYGGRNQFG